MPVTFEQANEAKKLFLAQIFNPAADRVVSGAGIAKDADGWHIKANLKRDPTTEERASLPQQYNHVRIEYEVVGRVIAAAASL